jgi:hypothetical protein
VKLKSSIACGVVDVNPLRAFGLAAGGRPSRVLDCAPATVEKITREQMLSESARRASRTPKVVDLIGVDPVSDKVVLTMIERRPWGADQRQFQQIEEKINRTWGTRWTASSPSTTRSTRASASRIRLECAEEAARRGGAVRAGGGARRQRSRAGAGGGGRAAGGVK